MMQAFNDDIQLVKIVIVKTAEWLRNDKRGQQEKMEMI